MANVGYNGLVAVTTLNSASYILAARSDIGQISLYDTWLFNNTPYTVFRSHVATIPGHKRFKPLLVRQYGEGTITKALMILTVDKTPREAYDVSSTDVSDDGNQLIKQGFSGSLEGHECDITLYMSGYSLILRETVFEIEVTQ